MTRDYSARLKNRAQYLPAGQNTTHTMPLRAAAMVRRGGLPAWMTSTKDLDWLDASNPFFSTDRALFSAGQFIGGGAGPGMFNRRPGVTILCDSGGLQYGLGRKPWLGNASRAWSLKFLEANADEAITLDIPTKSIAAGHPTFNSYGACLAETLLNNDYYAKHRTRSDLRFLSVIQGTKKVELLDWYDTVKAVPFEGWAIAGAMRRDHLLVAELTLRIVADALLGATRNRIHVLGVSKLTDAVMLSALQRALREHLADDALQITYDTASPSKMAMAGQAYGYPAFSSSSFQIGSFKPPSAHVHAGSAYSWPIASSRIGEVMTVGDLSVSAATRQHGWDTLGNEMVVNHNIESMLRAIEDANAILEMPTAQAAQLAPDYLVRAYNATRTMFKYSSPLAHLTRFRADFAKL